MKKLLMIVAMAGFMTAGLGLNNSFSQDDPSKKRKTKTEEPDGTVTKEKDKKDGTVKDKTKNPDGTVDKTKTDADGMVKKEKEKSKNNY